MSQTNPRESAIWRYNGQEMYLDLTDVETVEHYEQVVQNMGNGMNNLPKDGSQSSILRAYCELLRGVFDDMFGEGTAEKLFGDRLNATEITEAYESFLAFVSEQGQQVTNIQNRIVNRYSPNRAARRAAK